MGNSFNNEIGMRVRLLREEYEYTREQLAEMAEISVAFLGKIECGEKGISAKTLSSLCRALRVTSDYILFGGKPDETAVQQAIAGLQPQEREQILQVLRGAIKILEPPDDQPKN